MYEYVHIVARAFSRQWGCFVVEMVGYKKAARYSGQHLTTTLYRALYVIWDLTSYSAVAAAPT